jgi:dTDP-4-dehydrorhamnose 3,5-epimerase
MNIKVTETILPGALIIEPVVYGDSRGFFLETWRLDQYRDLGIKESFVQDNHSRSGKNVLRGLHLQKSNPQGKLVRVARGKVFDVAADINPVSATFGKWVGLELSDENLRQFYVPPGYAHGFCVLSDVADFLYRCTTYYSRDDEMGVRWDDPDLNINWPIKNPSLSEKDKALPFLKGLKSASL